MKSSFTPEELAEIRAVSAEINRKESSCLLRHKIEMEILLHQSDLTKAALAVCILLENEIGLAGNGWFDGDDEVLAALAEDQRE